MTTAIAAELTSTETPESTYEYAIVLWVNCGSMAQCSEYGVWGGKKEKEVSKKQRKYTVK